MMWRFAILIAGLQLEDDEEVLDILSAIGVLIGVGFGNEPRPYIRRVWLFVDRPHSEAHRRYFEPTCPDGY